MATKKTATPKKPAGKPIRYTHGVVSRHEEPAPAVSREVSASLGEDGNYYIEWRTVWSEGGKPTRSRLGLSPTAYELLLSAMWELHVNRDRWGIPPKP